MIVWLDTWGPLREQWLLSSAERTRSRRRRAGSRRNKRLRNVGRFRSDIDEGAQT